MIRSMVEVLGHVANDCAYWGHLLHHPEREVQIARIVSSLLMG